MQVIELEVTEFVAGGEVGATGMGDNKSYTGDSGSYGTCVGDKNVSLGEMIKKVIACI